MGLDDAIQNELDGRARATEYERRERAQAVEQRTTADTLIRDFANRMSRAGVPAESYKWARGGLLKGKVRGWRLKHVGATIVTPEGRLYSITVSDSPPILDETSPSQTFRHSESYDGKTGPWSTDRIEGALAATLVDY